MLRSNNLTITYLYHVDAVHALVVASVVLSILKCKRHRPNPHFFLILFNRITQSAINSFSALSISSLYILLCRLFSDSSTFGRTIIDAPMPALARHLQKLAELIASSRKIFGTEIPASTRLGVHDLGYR